ETHRGPLGLDVGVDEIRADEARRIVQDPDRLDGVEKDVARDTRRAVERLALRALIVAGLGGALLPLLYRRRWTAALTGAGSGLLVVALAVTSAAATWRPRSLAEPRYQGLLTLAPKAVGSARDLTEKFSQYRAQLASIVGNLSALYTAAEGLDSY